MVFDQKFDHLHCAGIGQPSDLIADGRSLWRRHGEAEAIHFAGNPEDRGRFRLQLRPGWC